MTWSSGDRVIVRGADWQVIRSTSFSDCETLDLASQHSPATLTLLLPFDRPRSPLPPRFQVVSRKRWAREVSSLLRASYPYGGLQRCPRGIRLLPYQLEPALALLRHGELRILIADDVGLGKTVEAGLIVREISTQDRQSRTLILCPASIRQQWARELATLFTLQVTETDSAWLRRTTRELPAGVNPWSLPGIYLASADFIKRPETLHSLEHLRWDLLIVDEAHMASPHSERRVAIHALARRSCRLVLLTATPHSGDEEQFAALCRIGTESASSPIVLFRRSHAELHVGTQAPRHKILSIHLTDAERRTHRLLEGYTAQVWRESRDRGDAGGQLVATVLRKRALSSSASLAVSIRRRLVLLDEPPPLPSQLLLPLGDAEDIGEDKAGDEVIGAAGLNDRAHERAALEAIAAAAERASANESKLGVLLRFLRRAAEPAIVFTEYRDTAEQLAAALKAAGHHVGLLHGGLSHQERGAVVKEFTSEGWVLIATDAASEGLNLHYRCRLVVHFELPWFPSRLHQRCGRVNRIGQKHRVHEIALVANDTCEELVLRPLVQRARLASAVGGPRIADHLSESRIAAHVLENLPLAAAQETPGRAVVRTKSLDLREEAQTEVLRLELLRRADGIQHNRRTPRAPTSQVIPVSRLRRCDGFDGDLMVVLIVSSRDAEGALFERRTLALSVKTAIVWHPSNAVLRAQVEETLSALRPVLRSCVEQLAGDHVSEAAKTRMAALAAVGRRIEEMQHQLRSAARELVQFGLFDRRAIRAAGARDLARDILLDDLRAQSPTARSLTRSVPPAYEIGAVLVRGHA